MTSVTPVTPETVTLCPEIFAMVTLLRWMYLRKTSAFRLARVQALKCKGVKVYHEAHRLFLIYIQFLCGFVFKIV